MVWNEKLKQEIPDGWSDSTLSEICVMYQPQTIGMDLLLPNGVYRVYGANGIVGKYDQYNHEDSEIAMACRGNSCGVVNRTMPYSWITGNAMVLQMKDKGVSNEYIKQSVSYMNISGAISGSGQAQLTRENLNIVKCLKPAHNVLLSFSQLIEPIVTAQLHIIEENDKITKLLDELLPLLMNGQVSVNYHLSVLQVVANIGKFSYFIGLFLPSACRFEVDSPSFIFNGRGIRLPHFVFTGHLASQAV